MRTPGFCRLFAWFVWMSAAGACATAMPPDPVERALYVDALTVVRAQTRDEWVIDRAALAQVTPGLATSVCQVAPDKRAGLATWLDARIARESERVGGSAEEGWRRAGKDLDAVADLLELERVRAAIASVKPAECPFWLEVDPRFGGVQSDRHRALMFVESRGQVGFTLRTNAPAHFTGGGSGRLLFGYGLSDRFTLATGIEIGEAGRFDNKGEVTGALGGAFPLLMRFNSAGEVFDVELAAVTFFEGARGLPPGIRAAVGYGIQSPRIGGAFSPGAVFWIGYELHPRRGPDDPFHVIAIGTRIGVDVDL